ncbi:MmpS family transport accessory protein [Corynebacterium sp. 335C]
MTDNNHPPMPNGDANPYGNAGGPGNPANAGGPAYGGGQQQPQVVYVQKPEKPWYKKPGCLIPLILVALFILVIGGCAVGLGTAVNEVDKEMNAEHTVTYQIDGEAVDATAIYNVGETNSVQDTGLNAGWSKDVTVSGFWGAQLSVTNGPGSTGSITCRILENGEVLSENTATGEFATATCSADFVGEDTK